MVVCQLEDDLKHPNLGIVNFEDAAKQFWADFINGGAYRMISLAIQVPEQHRVCLIGIALNTDLGNTLPDLLVGDTSHCQASDIAFYVNHEYRHTQA